MRRFACIAEREDFRMYVGFFFTVFYSGFGFRVFDVCVYCTRNDVYESVSWNV